MARLTVATCQFPVSADVGANLRWIERQMRSARARRARVVHFPEGALSGYATVDFEDFDGYDWDGLRQATERTMHLARELGIWVVLGSAHPLNPPHLPHNCIYVVSDQGNIVDRYDKRFCAGRNGEDHELAVFSPGDHPSAWDIDGVRCGALICHEYRYPELYRQYVADSVELVFHSFHAANASPRKVAAIGTAMGPEYGHLNRGPTYTYPGVTMPASVTATAAANHLWISSANSSAVESLWPAFVVRADGVTVGRLRRNVPGLLIQEVDTDADLYDSTGPWRSRAIAGTLHSGDLVDDPRSADRTSL